MIIIIDKIQDHQELLAPTPPPPVVSDVEEEYEEESSKNPPNLPTPPPQQIIDAQIISVEVQRHHIVTESEQQLEDLAIKEEQTEIQDIPPELPPPSPKIIEESTVNIAPQAEVPSHEEEKEIVEMEVKLQNNPLEPENDYTKIQNVNDDDNDLGEIPPPDYSSSEETVLKNRSEDEALEIRPTTEGVLENINLEDEEVELDNKGMKEILEDSLEFSDENGNNTEPEEPMAEIKQPPIILPPMEVCLETKGGIALIMLLLDELVVVDFLDEFEHF